MANTEIADLLEREEKKAKERVAEQKKLEQDGFDTDRDRDIAMGGMSSSSDQPGPYDIPPEPMPASPDGRRRSDYPRRPYDMTPEPRASGEGHRRSYDMIPEPVAASDYARNSDPAARDPRRLDRPDFVGMSDGSDHHRYTNDRDENDERRTRRSRGQGDDDAANGASDKDSANGSGRVKHGRSRSRSPARPNSRGNHHRRDRDNYRPGRDRSPERRDDHRRNSSRNEYNGSRRGSNGSNGRYDHDDRRGGRGSRNDRRGPPRRRTPEHSEDDESDKRTVFVQQLAARLRTKQLIEFFANAAGQVSDGQIVKDRVSGRSKGVGYVTFKNEESVEKAISLTGQKLLGIPIIVQLTEAEKNRVAKSTEGGATQSNGIPFHRLYVGNIHFSITEDDLKNVFEPFGELEFVQLQKEEHGRSKGYGFVQFIDPTQAKEALEKMNGFELAGRPIRVGLGNDKFTPESTQSLIQKWNNPHQGQGSSFSGMGGRGAHAGGTGNFDRPSGRDVDKTAGASALDDTDVAGVNFNNYSREKLMRQLARIDEPEEKPNSKSKQKSKPTIVEPTPTRCIIIKHAYDQAEETDPDWQEDLKNEVRSECSFQYGNVVHLDLALDNNDGEIYIKFEDVEGAKAAMLGLNGRWFGGNQISATYVVDAVYNMNFPKALKV